MSLRKRARRPAWKSNPTDEELVALGQRDLPAALRLLIERYGAEVHRYCRRMLRDGSLADDVQQQVFFEAYRDLSRFQGRSSIRTWLFGIAHHRVLDAEKKRRRIEARVLDDESAGPTDAPDPRPSPADSLDDMRLRKLLADSLGDLSEHVRATVLLRYHMGLTFEEIASITGESAGAAQVRVSRALARLRRGIEGRLRPR